MPASFTFPPAKPTVYVSDANNQLSIMRSLAPKQDRASEVQLLTLRQFSPSTHLRLGGLVIARAVKFLGKLASSVTDQDTRDSWWEEVRNEIRSHARTLCCTHVVGYEETSTIIGDVCVLTATGTGAVIKSVAYNDVEEDNSREAGATPQRDREQNRERTSEESQGHNEQRPQLLQPLDSDLSVQGTPGAPRAKSLGECFLPTCFACSTVCILTLPGDPCPFACC
jgi:hypothetical protein